VIGAGGLWGASTPFILAVYGLTAVSMIAAAALSLLELRRWSRRARELESEEQPPTA
jgi:hypothetical protein